MVLYLDAIIWGSQFKKINLMKKRDFISILLVLILNVSLFSQKTESINMTKYSKIISALEHWNIKSALDELKILSTTDKPEDEPYFYFFKANITYCIWVQADSTNGNSVLKSIDSAVKYFERAMVNNPRIYIPSLYIKSSEEGLDSCAEIFSKKAKAYFLDEEYLKAMNYYDKIIEFNPKPIYLVGAGLTALKVTSYYKAESCFQQALKIQPSYEKAWIGLCETYKKLKNQEKAIETAKNAILVDSLNKTYLINYYQVSNFFKNESEIQNAIRLLELFSNQDGSVNQIIASHYISQQNFEKAELVLFKITSKQIDNDISSNMLKFYYQWFIHLNKEANLFNSKANSFQFSSLWVKNRAFIHQKVKKYLTLKTDDIQLNKIILFFNSEFNDY